ncbi:hypothetical protein [Paenibacillus chitinolyticus]|uniref:hypothetical protein n=1 Tax=Paenibacillus chitinolyticus TaxID=79263 RepID=UPI001C44F5A6|nr:hypothetical protein [Paenibacillus chitinolyticus]MBV6713977.1 hypothetical protein [Paenibacillus chitinolyticus]
MDNRLGIFLGKPVDVLGLPIHSPTIHEIAELGEIAYNIYLTLATFNKENVLKYLLRIPEPNVELLHQADAFELLTASLPIRNEIAKALSFFTKQPIVFDEERNAFYGTSEASVNRKNYKNFISVIQETNGISEQDKQTVSFKNDKAKKMYNKLQKLRDQYKKTNTSDSLGLKDILSILCNADGNGIHIFNVSQLTIYQVYEQFERLNLKEQHTRLLRVWANGYLGKDEQLPEWLVKSRL